MRFISASWIFFSISLPRISLCSANSDIKSAMRSAGYRTLVGLRKTPIPVFHIPRMRKMTIDMVKLMMSMGDEEFDISLDTILRFGFGRFRPRYLEY